MAKKSATAITLQADTAIQNTKVNQWKWTTKDIETLISFIIEHELEAKDNFTFKPAIWTGTAVAVAQCWTVGAVKIPKACKAKWKDLKTDLKGVQQLYNQSDFVFLLEHGLDYAAANSAVIDTFIAGTHVFYATQATARDPTGRVDNSILDDNDFEEDDTPDNKDIDDEPMDLDWDRQEIPISGIG
ncbi:hypothetical protein SERLA73DRAFT_69978 [Serpula lacrymans var. lacrymans S7.3]|uniref:Myb-like domain-containing protein n=2 Tax=Serpula lacrymans var. lacrymans TaxID=341189 RepID=F8PLJ3_SERL3|nr:uncharacterized protein SERLADRAFT_434057 [Serpula lacrymans var. lacrymans S7.9]EGO02475.1 hypothetical protein SERLA73DRAFT_69978 [Serpula lacrymans var. lacrymans S7.3]EGO28196.1 hypothetical protein SERLADRAFT_434057 [Serpula lacrymans var. lacrymans S7.9]